MTVDEIKEAIRKNSLVCFSNMPNRIAILTCMSDDETGAYYKPLYPEDFLPYGWRGFAMNNKIQLCKKEN